MIQELHDDLDGLGPGPDNLPQFSISTNAIRQNEYLAKRIAIQSDMIRTYAQYATLLEETSAGLVEIGRQMTELLRLQVDEAQR